MRSAFGKELAAAELPADQRKLAAQMLQTAAESKGDPAAAFVLMRAAADLAAKAGDVALAWQATGQLGSQYEVDVQKLNLDSLKTAADAATEPDQYESLISKHEELIERCIAAERFDMLDGVAASAENVAGVLGGAKMVFAWKERRQELAEVSAVATTAAIAKAELATNPTDAKSHGEFGRYLCFVKGDWAAGAAHLAKGDDEMLRSLAERELKQSAEKDAQIALGDGWRGVADKLTGRMRSTCLLHAKAYYENAAAKLTGLDQALAQRRLHELKSELGSVAGARAGVLRESYAARFTNQAHVEIQNSEGLVNLNRDFTIEVWARWPPASQSEYLAGDECWPQYPKHLALDRARGWVLRYRVWEGKPVLDFTVAIRNEREWLSTLAAVKVDQQWHHVAACRTKDRIVLYLDGEPIAENKVESAALIPSPTPVYLGCRKGCYPDRQFTGEIGRFRVSNVARYPQPFDPQGNWPSDERTLIHFDFRSPAKEGAIRDRSGNDLAGVFSQGVNLVRLGDDAIAADEPPDEPPLAALPAAAPKPAGEPPLVGTYTIFYTTNQTRREYVFDGDGTVTMSGLDTVANAVGPIPRAVDTHRAHVVWRKNGEEYVGLIYWDQHEKLEVVSVDRNGKPTFALYVLEQKTVGSGEKAR